LISENILTALDDLLTSGWYFLANTTKAALISGVVASEETFNISTLSLVNSNKDLTIEVF
jgi:hypothetical protein